MEQYAQYQRAVEEALAALPLLAGEKPSASPVTQASPAPPTEGEAPQPLRSAMAYSLLLPGKRLRPVLLLASPCLGKTATGPFACQSDSHLFLVHDDLPPWTTTIFAGQAYEPPGVWENMAILAGDGLWNMAYETMFPRPVREGRRARPPWGYCLGAGG